jgi:hypothetical protein
MELVLVMGLVSSMSSEVSTIALKYKISTMNKLLKSIYDIKYFMGGQEGPTHGHVPNNQEQLGEAQEQTGKEEHV